MTVQQKAIQVERIDLLDCDVTEELSRAFKNSEKINAEFGLDWLRHLAASTLTSDETAYIYTARDDKGRIVALPLRVNHKSAQAHALSNFYTSLYSPILQSTQSRALLCALFDHLRKSEQICAITLSPLSADNEIYSALEYALKNSNWRGIHSWHCFWNWTHTVEDGGYLNYLVSRPSILKNTITRKTRKFLASEKGSITLITDITSAPEAIDQFQSVYRRSWKKAEPHAQFIPGLLKLAAEKKWLRLAMAYYDGQAIAAQLWLVHNNTASIFKLAYDENFKHLSPGTILSAFLMKHVIDVDQVKTIDYLSGDDSYKEDWMTDRRERRGIAAYNLSCGKGVLAYCSHQLKHVLKKIMPGVMP